MAEMTHRTTFSLDDRAIQRLRSLSRRWKVSQAEVIRRALEAADQQPDNTALADLEAYHHKGGLVAEKADSYLKEWSESREDWGS